MSKLTITDTQAALVQSLDAKLQEAFAEGTASPTFPNLLALMTGYSTLDSPTQAATKQIFESIFAATVSALNIQTANTGLTTTITLAKLSSGGAAGSLTFVNGILTAKVDPT